MDTIMDKWNFIVAQVDKKRSALESEVQQFWVELLSDSTFFGYSKFAGEVDSQRSIIIGRKERVIPDIIIRDSANNRDLFVIELKQHNLTYRKEYKDQLISYMKLLSLKIGVLICDKIYLFFDNRGETISLEISFEKNSENGCHFIELFSKGNFDENQVRQWIERNNELKLHVQEMQSQLKDATYLEDLIRHDFAKRYTNEEIDTALGGIKVSIQFPDPHPQKPMGIKVHTTRNGIVGKGEYIGKNSFKVFANSQVQMDRPIRSVENNKLRNDLFQKGDIALENGKYILKIDLEFDTPSAAATFILGRSANGFAEWKDDRCRTLNEILGRNKGNGNQESAPIIPPAQAESSSSNSKEVFFSKRRGVMAQCTYRDGKTCLLAGSQIDMARKILHNDKANAYRADLQAKGDIVSEGDRYILKTNVEFKSPSAAIEFVLGGSINGWESWTNAEGKTLSDVYRKTK